MDDCSHIQNQPQESYDNDHGTSSGLGVGGTGAGLKKMKGRYSMPCPSARNSRIERPNNNFSWDDPESIFANSNNPMHQQELPLTLYQDIKCSHVWNSYLECLEDYVVQNCLEETEEDLELESFESDFREFADVILYQKDGIPIYHANSKIIKQVQDLNGINGLLQAIDCLINNTKHMDTFLTNFDHLLYAKRHYLILPGFGGSRQIVELDFQKLINLPSESKKQQNISGLRQDRLGSVLMELAGLNEKLKKNQIKLSKKIRHVEYKKIPNLLRTNSLRWSILTALEHNLISITPEEDAEGNKTLKYTTNARISSNFKTPIPSSKEPKPILEASTGKLKLTHHRHVRFQLPMTPEELLGKDKENRNRRRPIEPQKGKRSPCSPKFISEGSVKELMDKRILIDDSTYFNSGANSSFGDSESTVVGSEKSMFLSERTMLDLTDDFANETMSDGSTIIENQTIKLEPRMEEKKLF